MCDFYYFKSCLSDNNIRIRAKVYKNSEQFAENLKVSIKRIEDKRATNRGRQATEEARGKNKSINNNSIENVFGRIVKGRNQRRRVLGMSNEQVSSGEVNLQR